MSAQPQSVGAIYVYINSICTWMVGSWAKCPGLGYVTLLLAFLPRSLSRFSPFPARRELRISAQIVINDARQPAVPPHSHPDPPQNPAPPATTVGSKPKISAWPCHPAPPTVWHPPPTVVGFILPCK